MSDSSVGEQAKANCALAQQAAELLWAVATSYDARFAAFNSAPYKAAEDVFDATIKVAYDLSDELVSRVRGLLAEFGPHDAPEGTKGNGVEALVNFAKHEAEVASTARTFKHLPGFMRRQATDTELGELMDAANTVSNWVLAAEIEDELELREINASDSLAGYAGDEVDGEPDTTTR